MTLDHLDSRRERRAVVLIRKPPVRLSLEELPSTRGELVTSFKTVAHVVVS